jgi:hypothetical protein
LHSSLLERLLGSGDEVEIPIRDDALSEALAERSGHFFADLVATRTDPRSDHGGQRLASERLDTCLRDAFEETPPADME